jgi:hypothetical protein
VSVPKADSDDDSWPSEAEDDIDELTDSFKNDRNAMPVQKKAPNS